MSEIRVDKIINSAGSGSVEFTQGITIPTGQTLAGTAQTAQGLTSTANVNTTGIITATSFSGSGASLTTLNASNISSGTVPTARLASGTANSSTFLRGDQTWAATGLAITDDTSTNATRYVVFDDVTSGTVSAANVSSTKLTFNPSTGTLSATVFTSLSDASQKTNIRSIENSIELVNQLEGVRFDWIENNKPSLGVIAQEIEKVLPELVTSVNTEESSEVKTVNYNGLVGLLIEAIKDQQNQINTLKEEIQSLKQ